MPDRRGRQARQFDDSENTSRRKPKGRQRDPVPDRQAGSRYRHRALKEAVIIEELEEMEEEYSY